MKKITISRKILLEVWSRYNTTNFYIYKFSKLICYSKSKEQ